MSGTKYGNYAKKLAKPTVWYNSYQQIYISENWTRMRRKLVCVANEFFESNNITYTSTVNDFIYVRKIMDLKRKLLEA